MQQGAFPTERRFKCPHCKRRFKTTGGLMRHGYACWPKELQCGYRQAIKVLVLK